jgi:hypothetical protein
MPYSSTFARNRRFAHGNASKEENVKTKPLLQFHFRFRGRTFARMKPTRETLRELARQWLDTGKQRSGVRCSATLWGKPSQRRHIRTALKGRTLANICPGIVSHYADESMTLCDYDTPKAPKLAQVWKVAQSLGLVPLAVEYQASRRGWHLAVTWNREFIPAEIVAIQLLLDSDHKREKFNLRRVLSGGAEDSKHWNILFHKKLPSH